MALVKFLLDTDGGSLAFLKEDDVPDWSSSIYRSGISSAGNVPNDNTDSNVLECSEVRRCVAVFQPGGGVSSYKFEVYGWVESTNIQDFYLLEGGVFDGGYSKNKIVKINVQGISDLYILMTEVSGGNIDIEYAPIPYEE